MGTASIDKEDNPNLHVIEYENGKKVLTYIPQLIHVLVRNKDSWSTNDEMNLLLAFDATPGKFSSAIAKSLA
jgi:hypothetical protein